MGGFGLAGLSRRLLVWPASMIWPYNLVITTSLNTLHAGDDPGSPGITVQVLHDCPGFRLYLSLFPGSVSDEGILLTEC
jgi:hypothetical protein